MANGATSSLGQSVTFMFIEPAPLLLSGQEDCLNIC